jgi:membrane protein YdbS with pleckstrin-like domain
MRFTLKPIFIGWITLLTQLPLQLFFTIWCGGFLGGLWKAVGLSSQDSNIPFIVCGGATFIGIPLVIYIAKKFNYQRTEYVFYDDYLEFEEGFFTINKKIIKFKDVREVTLRRGILQRMYGLGTVYLATLATGSYNNINAFSTIGFGNISASGVSVRDIKDSEEIY